MKPIDLYARHGGIHFKANVSAQEINQFVNQLSEEKRDSMFEVMKELEAAGMIKIINDSKLADGKGKIGGSNDCIE